MVERVREVNKNGIFFHWKVPQREYVIDKPLPNKGFLNPLKSGLAVISRFPRSAMQIYNGESDRHCSSHSNAVSLYEVLFIKLKGVFFKYGPH